MSLTSQALKDIQSKLDDPLNKALFIEQILSENFSDSDEAQQLIHSIIKTSYLLGLERAKKLSSELARAKMVANSDNHAISVAPIITKIREGGIETFQGIADALNEQGITTRSGHQWYPGTVRLVVQKIYQLERQGINRLDEETRQIIEAVDELQQKGVKSYRAIADALNEQGIKTKYGYPWHATSVKSLIKDISALNKIRNGGAISL